jgi:hypothetical protein
MDIEIQNPGRDAHAALDERLLAFNRSQRPQANWNADDVSQLC